MRSAAICLGAVCAGTLLAGLFHGLPARAASFTLSFDFDDLNGSGNQLFGGTEITDQFEDDGIAISFEGANGPLTLFDSNCISGVTCTGDDGDLATGPGAGNGNALDETLGNLLIISEDGDLSDPDDAIGGTIVFEFLEEFFPAGITLESIVLVDVVDDGGDGNVDIFGFETGSSSSTPLFTDLTPATFLTPNFGDNSIIELDFEFSPANPIERLEIDFPGSGAVAAIVFAVDDPPPTREIPEPLSVVGSAVALGMGYARKRRAKSA